jgi:hypothetical protein
MIRVVHPRPGSQIRILIFYQPQIPDPDNKKSPDPDPQHCFLLLFEHSAAVLQIMEVLQALVLKANLDQGSEQPDPTLQRIKGVAEDCLKRAHEMGIVRYNYPCSFLLE